MVVYGAADAPKHRLLTIADIALEVASLLVAAELESETPGRSAVDHSFACGEVSGLRKVRGLLDG